MYPASWCRQLKREKALETRPFEFQSGTRHTLTAQTGIGDGSQPTTGRAPDRPAQARFQGRHHYHAQTRRYLMRDGSTRPANVSYTPTPRVQAVVEQRREAEMIQAIDRLRLIHNEKRKTVYIYAASHWTSQLTSWSPGRSSRETAG
jgi:hypothetical protein